MSPKKHVHITPDKVSRIKDVCSKRTESRGEEAIIEHLKAFITTALKSRMLDLNPTGRWENMELSKRRKLYEEYEKFDIKVATLNRAFNGTGITRTGNYYHLEDLLDLYLEEYETVPLQTATPGHTAITTVNAVTATSLPPFSQQSLIELSHRASLICSYPECNRLTSGPSMANPAKAYYLGEACLIRGARPGDPRYDPRTPHTTDDIENGIWLCTFHAQMVNQHDGIDYPAALLQDWKSAHEQLMHACMEGKKRIIFALNQADDQSARAVRILTFFNAQQPLFDPWGTVPGEHLVIIVKNISAWLLQENAYILLGSRLQQQVYAIDYACDAFLALAAISDTARFMYAFAAFKKALGMMLHEMTTCYQAELPPNISTIIPQHTNPAETSI